MKFHRLVFVVVAALAISSSSMNAAQAKPAPLTYQQIAALSPAQQAAILDPLRAVANAAGTVGRSQWSEIYSGIRIDASAQTVTIYLTALGQKSEFLADIREIDKTADLKLARFAPGGYTFTALVAASDAVMQRRDPNIESVSVPADGSALHVRAFDVAHAKQLLAEPASGVASLAGPVPTVVEKAEKGTDMSRLRDTPQWISGEALTQSSDSQSLGWSCTSGLPARRNSDGRSFLITAAHCYGNGATVYTGWQSGGRNRIGVVTNRDNIDDAIAIDTSSTGTTASREWDGAYGGPYQVLDVSGATFSYEGDMTCQDGYSSGIVCGLKVNNGTATWTGSDGVAHRGVEAHQVDGLVAGRSGDSGGLVFVLQNGGSIRQARGIVSNGGGTMLRWTEAPYIFSAFGFTLAP